MIPRDTTFVTLINHKLIPLTLSIPVGKEMYTIIEDDGDRITLRPEFTAGMVRAYLQNGMANWPQPVKIYSIGPVFRRERPQAARFREHSQFNPEILGTWDPAADLEMSDSACSR